MLDQAILDQVKSVFAGLKNNYTFQVEAPESHPSSNELINLLEAVSSVSPKIDVLLKRGAALSFSVLKNGEPSTIVFRAVPTGHEFTTLLLVVLNMDGIGKNLPDEAMTRRIQALKHPVKVKSYISLTCTNCPDVVQALNILSILNPKIEHEIIDGGINQAEVEKLSIQAVPSVYANGELMHVGRSSMGELLGKIEELAGSDYDASVQPAKEYDVIVAGGGPAGVAAAIYSARKGFAVALVAEKVGGQVTETMAIENMISVRQTTGTELSANMKQHLGDYPIDVLENRLVKKAELADGFKIIETSLGEKLVAPALIIATGASWRKLNVPGESDYIGSGVAFCTHCDGPFYKGKKVAVIGGGNSGLEAAIDLSSIASEVTVLEFMDSLKGDRVLQNKLAELSNVKIVTGVETREVIGDGAKVSGLRYRDRTSGKENQLTIDGVFVQIGLSANSSVFASLVETNRMGEIKIDAHCRTSQPGIYAAGDVSEVPYKQIVIAMGEGSKAALSAFDDKIKGLQLGVPAEAAAN
ncbi:alkyl hydroperoxide reductase subunit F [Mangrovibacterium sp.]|uniref:alkyl hydroperoxide reductase subunit F n=1 Tax=Mangrovibacterium sp. TaxID=1961364 RepID=UPI00356698A7